MFWPKHRRHFRLDRTLYWSHFTVDDRDPLHCKDRNTACHCIPDKSVGPAQGCFLDKYVELRSQYPSSFETDGAHQVIKMRDERKVQHLRGAPTHPRKQFTRTCISRTICIQSSLLELDHFLIFFTFGLERLSLFLRVSTAMCGTLGSNLNCLPPWLFHYPCRVPLMTLLQFIENQACREILVLVPSHMAMTLCKGTEKKELRQERSQGSDPFVMLWASRCQQWH